MKETIGLKRGEVILLPHQKSWETDAQKTIAVLKEILKDEAVDIQHVGSTAISSISAKPVIDIAVGCRDLSEIGRYREALEDKGIIYRGQEHSSQLLFVMGDFKKDTRTHHIHFVRHGSDEWNDYLDFRDYLNSNEKRAADYQQLKEQLSIQYAHQRQEYTSGKQPLIDEILREARKWRKRQKEQQ